VTASWCVVAAPLSISPGWYRLAVGCYIVIVIGWFAGVIAAFRSAIYAFAHKAETRIVQAASAFFNSEPQEVRVERRRGATGLASDLRFHCA